MTAWLATVCLLFRFQNKRQDSVLFRVDVGGWRRSGSFAYGIRNNHMLFRNASTSSSGWYRANDIFEGLVLAIAHPFSLRSACR